ncbi:60S ribosomal protein L6 [Dionaea muscipula]
MLEKAIKDKNGGAFPHHEGKPAKPKLEEKPPKFYIADDVKKPLKNKRKHNPTKLRSQSSADSITPGTVLIDFACWKVYGEESCVLEAAFVGSPSCHW